MEKFEFVVCPQCGELFLTAEALKRHKRDCIKWTVTIQETHEVLTVYAMNANEAMSKACNTIKQGLRRNNCPLYRTLKIQSFQGGKERKYSVKFYVDIVHDYLEV